MGKSLRLTEEDKKVIRAFWEDEIIASEVYLALANKVKDEQRELFLKLSEMERGHAELWNEMAKEFMGEEFRKTFGLKIKILFFLHANFSAFPKYGCTFSGFSEV